MCRLSRAAERVSVAPRANGADNESEGAAAPTEEVVIDSKELAELVLSTALEKKAFDPVWLNVGEAVGYADYFVICSARNPRQVRAIADAVRGTLKKEHGLHPVGVEGLETNKWVLVDFDDVVLHVFQESTRAFYDLDGLWGDAPRLPVPAVEGVEAAEQPFFSLP